MLSSQVIDTVKATAPALEQHGENITKRFYERLFAANPGLKNVFNQSNQNDGRQARALADAVYAYAINIEQPEALLGHVKRIGSKHASIGIRPEHYPLVGQSLLGAIKDVLGDAANDAVIDAWGQAYQVLADIFIGVEKEMYQQSLDADGGWQGLRRFEVSQKVKESEFVSSFYLKPVDNGSLPPFKAGQYISVHITNETGQHVRQYSLSDAPGNDYLRISVKREPGINTEPGVVSNYLHQEISTGDYVEITPPAGVFCLVNEQSDQPLCLISAGVGVTPIMSMLKTALKHNPHREIVYVYAAENKAQHSFQAAVEDLNNEHANLKVVSFYNQPEAGLEEGRDYHYKGLIDLSRISIPDNADYYFCGPMPFMRAVNQQLGHVPEGQRHYEVFGPTTAL